MAATAPRPRRARWLWVVVWMLVAGVMVQAPGCSCRQETAAEKAARLAKEEAERVERERKAREEAKLRQPVQLPPALVMPAAVKEDTLSVFAKPGHWNVVRQPAKANVEDFDGLISYEAVAGRGLGRPSGTRLISRRPLVVARESEKAVDSLFYCPPLGAQSPRLVTTVLDRRSGLPVMDDFRMLLRPLQEHQFHFVVLGKEPERYAFLDSLFSFTANLGERIDASEVNRANLLPVQKNYRLVSVPTRDPAVELALPDIPLAWTSIAYVLWDEVDPDLLTPDQRDALVDWLNWGGQLIVSGPDSLDLLRGSFLEPVLAAASNGARELEASDVKRLDARWSAGKKGRALDSSKPWTGVRLDPAPGASAPPGLGGLVAERRVGRGRVLVTAFSLTDPRLLAWSKGFDNFFNGVILRRPARRFVTRPLPYEDDKTETVVRWDNADEPLRIDPTLNTKSRGFVRDAALKADSLAFEVSAESGIDVVGQGFGGFARSAPVSEAELQGRDFRIERPSGNSTLGAVNNFGPVAGRVRGALRDSAGVSVPDASFVVGCLAAYLFFLVPANWGFFAAIRRVELAWVAAPIIALAGAWVVIQQARLDIGFVRSRTEIAVLEMQPDTPRALLTRFTALYTSLSTTYEATFDNPAVAAPFPRGGEDRTFGPPPTVAFERLDKTRLKDIAVSSATTEFLRSEEMLDVSAAGVPGSTIAGSLRVTAGPSGPRLENRTAWRIEDAIVVERPDGLKGEPRLEGCWVGDLAPGEVANVAFLPVQRTQAPEGGEAPLPFDRERAEAARRRGVDPAERLDLTPLLRIALDPEGYEPGERRVVALTPEILPGMTIEPKSSQRTGATLVIGHLAYGPLPPPASDVNGPLDR